MYKEIISKQYSKFVLEHETPVLSTCEADTSVLKFYAGTGIKDVSEVLGDTAYKYVNRFPDVGGAIQLWLEGELEKERKVFEGNKHSEKDCVLRLPDNNLLVWDTEFTPHIKNKKTVGAFITNVFPSNRYTPEEVLNLYRKTYKGDAKKAAHAFSTKYEVPLSLNPREILMILANGYLSRGRKLEGELGYTTDSKRSSKLRLKRKLNAFNLSLEDAFEIILENHKKGIWRAE